MSLFAGKGDLVGCDISQHLMACSNGQGGSNQHGSSGGHSNQDVIVKSSSDVKVMYMYFDSIEMVEIYSAYMYRHPIYT